MPLKITRGKERIICKEGVREPHLLKLKNKDLLLTFHADPDVHFAHRACFRSTDNGKTWKKDKQRAHREQAIGQSRDGTVIGMDIYTFEKKPGEYLGSYFLSKDGGKTFSGP